VTSAIVAARAGSPRLIDSPTMIDALIDCSQVSVVV